MITLGDIILGYLAYLEPRPSAVKYRQVYRQYFDCPAWRDRPAHSITRHDILLFKQTLHATPAQCSKGIGLIKQAYQWAMDRIDPTTRLPYYDGQNPAWRISKHDSFARERIMDRAEIRLLLHSLDFLNLKYQAFFVARLITPCRIKELCEMRRADVDLQTGKWFKRITKNGRPQYVLIPRQAVAYLRQLPIEGEYFFLGAYGRPLQPESARKIWSTFRADLKMADVQLLDFRRTLASYLYTEIHADELTAKAVLNHYDGRPVAVYTRLNYDRLADIIQRYADWIWQLHPQGAHHDQNPHHLDRGDLPRLDHDCPEHLVGSR